MKESYEWVLKCIESSTTDWHFKTCAKIINLFSDQYYNLGGQLTSDLWDEIRTRAHEFGYMVPYNEW